MLPASSHSPTKLDSGCKPVFISINKPIKPHSEPHECMPYDSGCQSYLLFG